MAFSKRTDNLYQPKKPFFKTVGVYGIAYLLFAIVVISLIFLLFQIRGDAIAIGFELGNNKVIVRGISNLTVVITGILMLVGVVYGDEYLRRGIEANRMWKHILRIYLVAAAAWVADLVLYNIIIRLIWWF